jgi:hypothetical protein
MQILQPLESRYVALAARHILDVAGIHQTHTEPTVFQNLMKRNPEDASGLHDHGLYAALLQPIGDSYEVVRESAEAADRLGITIRRNRYIDLRGADVDTRRVRLQDSGHLARRLAFENGFACACSLLPAAGSPSVLE